MSSNQLLTVYMEKNDSRLKLARRQAALGVWAQIIRAMVDLNPVENEELCIAITGGKYVLTGGDCPDLTEKNNFEVRKDQSSGFFMLVSQTESIFPRLYFTSQTYMHYSIAGRKKLAELLCLEGVYVPTFPAFFKHVYLQHRRCGWCSFPGLEYHKYLITVTYKQKDAVSFAYCESFIVHRNAAALLEK